MSENKRLWNDGIDGPRFEFYVIQRNVNGKKMEMFNIFRNWPLYEAAVRETRRHLANKRKYPREKYEEEMWHLICWQERGRCEYEILAGDLFAKEMNELEKWDAAKMAEPNISIICDMCISRYKEWKKAQKNTAE